MSGTWLHRLGASEAGCAPSHAVHSRTTATVHAAAGLRPYLTGYMRRRRTVRSIPRQTAFVPASRYNRTSNPNHPEEILLAEDKLYKAEYQGSGTFIISKPKRKKTKARQSQLKNPQRGSRK